MKTISFDIGIKNMAYCIFDCSSSIDILDWKVLNLNEENTITKETCNAIIQNKKQGNKVCGKTQSIEKNRIVIVKHMQNQANICYRQKKTN